MTRVIYKRSFLAEPELLENGKNFPRGKRDAFGRLYQTETDKIIYNDNFYEGFIDFCFTNTVKSSTMNKKE